MKLTLGPVPFKWSFNQLISFYQEVSETSIDEVYIGETVCYKRGMFSGEQIIQLASIVEGGGKKVNTSALVLMKNENEIESARELLKLDYPVEANNAALLNMTEKDRDSLIVGSSIPVYNRPTAEFLVKNAKRIVLSAELSSKSVEDIACGLPGETETLLFGRASLGNSWKCYTTRYRKLDGIDCGKVCDEYLEGIDTKALSDEDLWNINGTQVLSSKKISLVKDMEALEKAGITHLRILPQLTNLSTIVDIHKQVIDGHITAGKAAEELAKIEEDNICNGWFHGQAGLNYV